MYVYIYTGGFKHVLFSVIYGRILPIDELIFFKMVIASPTSNHFSRILTNNYTNIDPVVDYFLGFWGHGMSMGILHSFLVYCHHSMGVSTYLFYHQSDG